jgi:succinoglycan biosynthesis protein ExoM
VPALPSIGGAVSHIAVCICTFRRPKLLLRLLEHLREQDTANRFTFSIVVVDNDMQQSARDIVSEFAARSSIEVRYVVQPVQNIARARNSAVASARGEFIAFIDDDEFPTTDWLSRLLDTCQSHEVAGVLGPVEPHFEAPPPNWILKGRMFNRATHETGFEITIADARTGNVLLRRSLVEGVAAPFDEQFGTGGEDVDFFRRLIDVGHRFVWCSEAVVYEVVPAARCTRGYLLRRALLRGSNSFRQTRGRARKLLDSSIALPAYSLALPFLWVAGDHYFMRYLIKWCDHAGRILACFGLDVVRTRDP